MSQARGVQWFGPHPWGAPVCLKGKRAEVPVGNYCDECIQNFTDKDRGFILIDKTMYHFDCMCSMFGISFVDYVRIQGKRHV